MLHFSLSSFNSTWQQWHLCSTSERIFWFASCICVNNTQKTLNRIGMEENLHLPTLDSFHLFWENCILKTSYPRLQNLWSYINYSSSERRAISFHGVWSFFTYWLFQSLQGCTLPGSSVVKLVNAIRFDKVPGPFKGIRVLVT